MQETENQKVKKSAKPELDAETMKAAMAAVCEKLGTTPEELDAIEADRKEKKRREGEKIQLDLGRHECSINGELFTGRVTVSLAQAETIVSAVNSKRMRILRESISHEYLIDNINSGGVAKLVKAEQQ